MKFKSLKYINRTLLRHLRELGYVDDTNLFVATWDYRFAPDWLTELGFFRNLQGNLQQIRDLEILLIHFRAYCECIDCKRRK